MALRGSRGALRQHQGAGRPLYSWSRDFLTNTTWDGVQILLGSASAAYGANGMGVATATSVIAAFNYGGGLDDKRVVGVVRYAAPTTQGAEDLGLLVRFQTLGGNDDSYYYIRVDGQTAKITPVIDNVFGTALATASFLLPPDTDCTIDVTVRKVGSNCQISATFSASGLADVHLEAADADLPSGGLVAFRTLSQVGWIKSLTVDELQ